MAERSKNEQMNTVARPSSSGFRSCRLLMQTPSNNETNSENRKLAERHTALSGRGSVHPAIEQTNHSALVSALTGARQLIFLPVPRVSRDEHDMRDRDPVPRRRNDGHIAG